MFLLQLRLGPLQSAALRKRCQVLLGRSSCLLRGLAAAGVLRGGSSRQGVLCGGWREVIVHSSMGSLERNVATVSTVYMTRPERRERVQCAHSSSRGILARAMVGRLLVELFQLGNRRVSITLDAVRLGQARFTRKACSIQRVAPSLILSSRCLIQDIHYIQESITYEIYISLCL